MQQVKITHTIDVEEILDFIKNLINKDEELVREIYSGYIVIKDALNTDNTEKFLKNVEKSVHFISKYNAHLEDWYSLILGYQRTLTDARVIKEMQKQSEEKQGEEKIEEYEDNGNNKNG